MLYQLLSVLSFAASLTGAPDSTVTLGTQVFVQGLVPSDTVRYEYYAAGVLKFTKRSPQLTNKVTVAAPAYGATTEYKGCAQVERANRTFKVPAVPLCWTWSYTRPLPPLAMDSLKQIVMRPPQVSLLTGASHQFCAFGLTKAGRKVKLENAWNRPECEPAFQAWLSEVLS